MRTVTKARTGASRTPTLLGWYSFGLVLFRIYYVTLILLWTVAADLYVIYYGTVLLCLLTW